MPLKLANPDEFNLAFGEQSFGDSGLRIANPEEFAMFAGEIPPVDVAEPMPQSQPQVSPPVEGDYRSLVEQNPPPSDASEWEQIRQRRAMQLAFGDQGQLTPEEDASFAAMRQRYESLPEGPEKSAALRDMQIEEVRRGVALQQRQQDADGLRKPRTTPFEWVQREELARVPDYEKNFFFRTADNVLTGAAGTFSKPLMWAFGKATGNMGEYNRQTRDADYDAQLKDRMARESGVPLDRYLQMTASSAGSMAVTGGLAAGAGLAARSIGMAGRFAAAQGLAEGGSRFADYEAAGNSVAEATLYGGLHALKTTAVTLYGGKFASKIGGKAFENWLDSGGKASVRQLAMGALGESLEEGADFALGAGLDYVFKANPDMTKEQFFSGLYDSMVVGAMAHTIMMAPSLLARSQPPDPSPLEGEVLPADPPDGPIIEGEYRVDPVVSGVQRFLANPSRSNAKALGYIEPKAEKRRKTARRVKDMLFNMQEETEPTAETPPVDAAAPPTYELPEGAKAGKDGKYRVKGRLIKQPPAGWKPPTTPEVEPPNRLAALMQDLENRMRAASDNPLIADLLDQWRPTTPEVATAPESVPPPSTPTTPEVEPPVTPASPAVSPPDESAISQEPFDSNFAIVPSRTSASLTKQVLRSDVKKALSGIGVLQALKKSTSQQLDRLMQTAKQDLLPADLLKRAAQIIVDADQSGLAVPTADDAVLRLNPDAKNIYRSRKLALESEAAGESTFSGDASFSIEAEAAKSNRPRPVRRRRRPDRKGFVYTGFLVPGPTLRRWARQVMRWLRTNLYSPNSSIPWVRQQLQAMEGFANKQLALMEISLNRLKKAARADIGGRPTPDYWQRMQEAFTTPRSTLAGRLAWGRFSPEVQTQMAAFRDQVDTLSTYISNLPGSGVDLNVSIAKNLGVYLTTSYRKFTEPNYRHEAAADPAIMQPFIAEYQAANPGASAIEAENVGRAILNAHTLEDVATSSNPLKKKRDVPPYVKRLMGEILEFPPSVQESIVAMTKAVARAQMVDEVLKAGTRNGSIFADLSRAPAGFNGQRVTQADFPYLRELDGHYVDKDVLEMLVYATKPAGDGDKLFQSISLLPRAWVAMMGFVNANRTVRAIPSGMMRNFIGNPLAMAAGGFVIPRAGELAAATKTAWAFVKNDFPKIPAAATKGADGKWRIGTREIAQPIEDLYLEMMQFGIFDEVSIGQLREMAKAVASPETLEKMASRGIGKTMGMTSRVYSWPDLFFKVIVYKRNVAMYREAYGPGAPYGKILLDAAELTKATMPTYSQVPYAVRGLSKYLPFGTFPTFSAEVMRNVKNRLVFAKQNMNSPHQALRNRAMATIGLSVGLFALPSATAWMSKILFGISDEEEAAFRDNLPQWDRNSTLIFLGGKDKGYPYITVESLNPWDFLTRPLTTVMRPRTEPITATQLAAEMGWEFGEAFTQPDILTQRFLDAMFYNKNQSGYELLNEGAGASNRAKLADEILDVMLPKTVADSRRLLNAVWHRQFAEGKRNIPPAGRRESIGDASRRLFGAIKVNAPDIGYSARQKHREYSMGIEDSEQAVRTAYIDTGSGREMTRELLTGNAPLSNETLIQRHIDAETQRRKTMEQWGRYMKGTTTLGRDTYVDVMGALGKELPKYKPSLGGGKPKPLTNEQMAMVGVYMPYMPSKEHWLAVSRRMNEIYGERGDEEFNRRFGLFMQTYSQLLQETAPAPE